MSDGVVMLTGDQVRLVSEPSDFQGKRRQFFDRLEKLGMTREHANYCITVGKRLREIYTKSEQIEALEHEELCKLRNVLHRMPSERNIFDDTETFWECIVGGLDEGDDTVLYIVPPGFDPVAVPLPVGFSDMDAVKLDTDQLQAIAQMYKQIIEQDIGRRARIIRNVELAADREGWSLALRSTGEYKRFLETMVRLETLRETNATATEQANAEAMARNGYECIQRMHARQESDNMKPRDQIAWDVPKEYQEPGYKQLQEFNERQKRRGRNAK